MKWAISRALSERLLREARAAGKAEICGLLTGQEGRIEAALPVRNAAPDPQRAFLLDPGEHVRLSREMRAAGALIVGCYHSHPSGDPRPSADDASGAIEPGRNWLILAGDRMALWRSRAGWSVLGAFEPLGLEIG